MKLKLPRIRVSVVLLNTVANYAGNILTALISFIFIPVYIFYLGIGSYGIIGFFASFQIFLSFLDLGIAIALNRELSRYYHDQARISYLRNLAHSLQIVYWSIGLAIGLILLGCSSFLSANWFQGSDIPRSTVYHAFLILSVTLAVRWPYSLYSSGIRGMQHQVVLNVNDLFWGLVKSVGSWVVLKYYSPTLEAFLWYQCLVTFLQTISTSLILWYWMPASDGTALKFDREALKSIGRYAAGMGAGALLGGIVQQLDKLLISRMVTATEFGYYILASNVATLVYNASLPMYMSLFPHFSKLVHTGKFEEVKRDFHFYSSMLGVILLPFSGIIFFAAEQVLWLWTKDRALAHQVAPLLRILIVGTTLNALIMPVHLLLLAHNKVRFMFYFHLSTLIVMVPLTILLVKYYGVFGGAIAISFLYLANIFFQALLIFRKIRMRELGLRWYTRDILQTLIPVAIIALLATRFWIGSDGSWSKSELVFKLGIATICAYFLALISNTTVSKPLLLRLKIIK